MEDQDRPHSSSSPREVLRLHLSHLSYNMEDTRRIRVDNTGPIINKVEDPTSEDNSHHHHATSAYADANHVILGKIVRIFTLDKVIKIILKLLCKL